MPQDRTARRALRCAVTLLVFATTPLGATLICRWTDADGHRQFADNVPARDRAQATCVESRRDDLSPEQGRAARQRVAEEQARARERTARATGPRAALPASAPTPAPAASAMRPAVGVGDATDCPTWWRLYDESAACFGPYRTTRGAVKAEAFERCRVIPSPALRCGLRSQ